MVEIVTGTCDGTGAAINVCLGFIPDVVKLWNVEHANEKSIEWFRGMELFTSMDEGVKLDNSVIAPVTANGIKTYAGGDIIVYDGVTDNRWEVAAIGGASAEEVYVDGFYKKLAAADAPYKCYGDKVEPNCNSGSKVKTAAGFTIGTDGINADGEQLCWCAMRGN